MSRKIAKIVLSLALPLVLLVGALVTPAGAAQSVRLQYRTSAPGATTAQSEPWFKLFNDGTTTIQLNQVVIRYYLTGTETYRFACSWAVVSCSTVTGRFVRQSGADQYLEVGFTSGSLAPGADTGDLQLRFYRADWQTFTQSDDYSYGPGTAYANWDKATVHVNGALAWGKPHGTEPTPTPTITPTGPGSTGVLFDDFTYSGPSDPLLAQRGWNVRSSSGGPGVPGATWSPSAVSFPGGLLTLDSTTNGTAAGTVQAELSTANRKFFEGTYGARVRFTDAPTSGPDGEHVVQTFFTITPLRFNLDPDYGELDFEYLPNGGWGEPSNILYTTSWETYQGDPWQAVNTHTEERASFAGWHDLVIQVSGGRIRYYVDGRLFADHGDIYYPETPMWIMFNQWFIDLQAATGTRTYRQQVDWLYYSKNEVVPPADVVSRVGALRAAGTAFRDTVPNS
ncbi:cellulose binding domain-containing protein [Nonomuraea wenchangensis]|uniref:Cellulose binding domain-containing protein n=1 Tax=Nonomuraea wenchangensis TaxID=568860 RepID=A0A1I0LND0_9ACTN|nr:cellulose binding domain-containing protein [Nonomuraea wenchangensis]SEU42647.1 Cellulose binding domain-containing protein [Nonomuraea wenchangensis]